MSFSSSATWLASVLNSPSHLQAGCPAGLRPGRPSLVGHGHDLPLTMPRTPTSGGCQQAHCVPQACLHTAGMVPQAGPSRPKQSGGEHHLRKQAGWCRQGPDCPMQALQDGPCKCLSGRHSCGRQGGTGSGLAGQSRHTTSASLVSRRHILKAILDSEDKGLQRQAKIRDQLWGEDMSRL